MVSYVDVQQVVRTLFEAVNEVPDLTERLRVLRQVEREVEREVDASIGRALHALNTEHGWSATKIAEALGLSDSRVRVMLAEYRRGTGAPTARESRAARLREAVELDVRRRSYRTSLQRSQTAG